MVRISISKGRRKSYDQVDLQDEEDTVFHSEGVKSEHFDTEGEKNISGRGRKPIIESNVEKRPWQSTVSFSKHRRRLPSYNRLSRSMRKAKDKSAQHQPMGLDEDDAQDEEEQKEHEGDSYDRNFISNKLMRRLNASKDSFDPNPNEQCMDAEYGDSDQYSSFNPLDVNYSPSNLRKMDSKAIEHDELRRKRQKLFILASAGIVMLLFIISIIVGGRSNIRHTQVAKPELDLEHICSISYWKQNGNKKCKTACESAKCCMGSVDHSCFTQNEDICGMYSPCGRLYQNVEGETVSVAPAPTNIGTLCNDIAISTRAGLNKCHSACETGQCCFAANENKNAFSVEQCGYSHQAVCATYTPCKSLFLNGVEMTSPVTIVNSVCEASNLKYCEGWDDCQNACEERSCCIASENNCRKGNEEYCDEFEACKILLQIKKPSMESKPPLEKCINLNNLSKEDLAECAKICDSVICCEREDGNCNVDCAYYEFCTSIWDDTNSIKTLPSADQTTPQLPSAQEVDKVCALETLSDKCRSLCTPYLCCFEKGYFEYSPSCNFSAQTCQEYSSCSKMIQSVAYTKVSVTGTQADQICSLENLTDETGLKKCVEFCESHMCCFSNGEDSCRSDCKSYMACGLIANYEEDNNGALVKVDIGNICSPTSIATDKGHQKCQAICNLHDCCLTGNCKTKAECKGYEACHKINNSLATSNLAQKKKEGPSDQCSIESMKADPSIEVSCVKKCQFANCCKDGGNCQKALSFCQNYSFCIAVWGYSKSVEARSDPFKRPSKDTTKMTQNIENSHEIESPSNGNGDDDDVQISMAMLQKLNYEVDCTEAKLATLEGKNRCKEACAIWDCCWADDDDTSCKEFHECIYATKVCPLEFIQP